MEPEKIVGFPEPVVGGTEGGPLADARVLPPWEWRKSEKDRQAAKESAAVAR